MQQQNMIVAGPGRAPLLDFSSFEYYDSFHKNVQNFLLTRGAGFSLPGGLKGWLIPLICGGHLHVYEEQIGESNCICDQCRIIGWGTHPVSSRRYHFIVPAEAGPDSLEDPNSLAAAAQAASSGQRSTNSLSLPAQPAAGSDAHVSVYNAPPTVFDSSRHRLHGVVHANGFGHLLRVNGREGGSRSHTGWQLTALWDALCSGLRVRVVTVEDVSMRGGMELRVLHTVAHGHTWYGQFGYEFGRGPYNTTETQWAAAGQYLTMASLNHLLQDFEAVEDRVRAIVERYRLPVGRAVKVKDLGTLLYRLLYLQSTPEDALLFFDPTALAKARRVLQAEEAAETAKRLGQKKVGPKAASTGTKKPQPSNGRGGAGAKGGASSAPPLPTIKLRLTGSSAERSKNDPVQSKKRPAESAHSGQEAKRSKSATIAGGSGASAVGLAAQQIQLVVGRRVKVYMKDKRTWYHGAVEKWDSAERKWWVAFRDFKHLVDLVSDLVQFSDGPPPPRAALTPKPESAASPQKPAALAPAVVPPRPMSAKEASELVGSRIRLYNVRHRKYYPVTVETVQEDQHTVKFENGSEQTVNLSKEKWQMVEEAQQAPKPEHKSPPAGELAPQLKPQASTAPADSRPVTRQARDVGASRHGGASTSAAPAVLDAMNITPLQYKLSLSRDDNIERARQLARALRSLMPASRDVIGSGKSRAELDNAFRRLTGKDAPKIDYGGAWWGCLKAVMQWAQETIHGSTGRGVQDAGNAIREEGDFLIIDRAALHRLGLFPEAWPMPLRAVSLCKANAAAASKAGLPKPTLFPSEAEKQQQQKQGPKDRGTSAKEQGDKKAEEPVKEEKKGRAPAPVPHGVRRVQLGCKRCRHGRVGCSDCQKREFNKLVEAGHADLVELLDRKECCKKEFGCRVCWEAVLEYEAKREKEGEAAAPASTGAIVPKIEADVPKEQQPSAVVEPKEEAPKHKPTSPAIPSRPNPKTSLKSRDRASGSGSAAAASAMQTSMPLAPRENAPSLPDQLQISDWGPPTISDPLPPAELPQDAHPWGVQRLLTAMNSILGIACAHPNRWVAPQRLLSLAMGSWKQQKSQDLILARAALGCLRNHSWQGFSMYEAQHPNGGVYYFTIATNAAPQFPVSHASPVVLQGRPIAAGPAAPTPQPLGQKAEKDDEGHLSKRQKAEAPAHAEHKANGISGTLSQSAHATQNGKASAKTPAATSAPSAAPAALDESESMPRSPRLRVRKEKSPPLQAPLSTQQTKIKLKLKGPADGKAGPPLPPQPARPAFHRNPEQQAAVDAAVAMALASPSQTLSPGRPTTVPPTPKPAWMDLDPGADIPEPVTAASARAQVSRDLHHLCTAVFKTYLPQVAKIAADNAALLAGERPAARSLKLKQLPDEVGVLRDTKHFVKVCSGEALGQGPQPPADQLRIWCKLALPAELSSPPISTTRFGRKFLPVDPPAVLVVVPSSASLGQFMEAVTQVYRDTYRMCTAGFVASGMVSGLKAPPALPPNGTNGAPKKVSKAPPLWNPASPLLSLLPAEALAGGAVPTVTVAGTGLDAKECWLHAGGPEDWIVACSCGTRDDDGEAMVACDQCGIWMHTRCMGVPDDTPAWQCPACKRRVE